jgi:hypothetical protein
VTRNELTLSLIRAGLYSGAWALDDDTYEPVSREFVSAAMVEFPSFLPPELRTMRDIGGGKKLAAPRWLPEVWDCDNLARAFSVYVGICMARDAVLTKRTRGNIAGGKLNFCPTPTTGHAINWFVDHEWNVFCVDCATLNVTDLTDAQRASIFAGESI